MELGRDGVGGGGLKNSLNLQTLLPKRIVHWAPLCGLLLIAATAIHEVGWGLLRGASANRDGETWSGCIYFALYA